MTGAPGPCAHPAAGTPSAITTITDGAPREHRSPGADDHLQRLLFRRVAEDLVGLREPVEREAMRDQLLGLQLLRLDRPEQHRGRVGIHQAGRERDVLDPELLDLEVDALAVDADVGDVAARPDDALAD